MTENNSNNFENFKVKVSVVIPTYNHAKFIGNAIASVLRQGIDDIEIIVVNNFSDDNTLEVIASFNDPRIKVINFKNNGVIAASRNVGLREAKGEFIAFLDSDDVWFDNKLKVQMKIFKNNPDILAVCSNAEYLPHQGIRKYLFVKLLNHRYNFRDFLISNRVIQSTLLMKREVIEKIGFLDENAELFSVEDYDYWLRIVEFRDRSIYLMKKPLIYYRVHNTNNFATGEKEFDKLKIIFQKYKLKYSNLLKRVCEYRKYYIKVIEIRERYRQGVLSKPDLLKSNEIKFFDKLDIIFKTEILKLIKLFR